MALTQMKNTSIDDDDDDLESLRLAALQTLQKKAAVPFDLHPSMSREHVQQRMYSPTHRRGRGSFNQSNRGRNGMFNNNQRSRNPNLISIPTEVEVSPPKARSAFISDKDTFKLTLPQDRYCNKTVEETKEQVSSKFNRYDNSDESESESDEEEESEKSDSESTGLQRAGSLEALMEELENEIKGKSNDPKPDPESTKAPKVKRRNKRVRTRTVSSATEKDILQVSLDTEPINSPEPHDFPPNVEADLTENNDNTNNTAPSPVKVLIEPAPKAQPENEPKLPQAQFIRKASPPQTMRNRSPPPHLLSRKQPNSPPFRQHRNRSPMRQRLNHNNYNNNAYNPAPFQPHQIPPFVQSYNQFSFPPFGAPPPLDIIHQQPPPFLPRSLSPLAINTEALCTITKAPLSPRSAAFVLQNREIIAQRRRKSPKRSPTFSRSPSPRRSLSPLSRRLPRSLSKSPIRNRVRSRSPLPPRRLSPPRGGRNMSPPRRRRSMSPADLRRNARKPPRERRSPPSKPSVRDRLGTRGREPVNKVEKTSEPDDKVPVKISVEEVLPEDPVLEARKRKFQRTEINVKDGGVIKLKKEEDQQQQELLATSEMDQFKNSELTELDQEALLLDDDTLLETKVEDIFSDDQSDDENEGRFKTSDNTAAKHIGISISKSLNGGRDIKAEPLVKERSSYKRRDQQVDRKRRRRSPSPSAKYSDVVEQDKTAKPAVKQRLIRLAKPKKTVPPRVTSPIENKKIEIKIRNPAKYEEASRSKYDVATEDESRRTDEIKQRGKKERRVDVLTTEETEEVVEETDELEDDGAREDAEDGKLLEGTAVSKTVESKSSDGGDLRTQLSRKRAERQSKLPTAESIQSRLLQSAIKDAVYVKKVKKSKKSKHRESALIDGKLPIHLRLGLGGSEVEIYTEHRKKNKKSKHRSLDQV